MPEPELPDSIVPTDLDAEARRDLRGLQKDTADTVARHLAAAGMLVDEDPAKALEHARFARRRASRIAVVREAAGITAYLAGEWNEALGELRAARRMGGGPGHLAVMADIERALGRPERALELVRAPEARELGRAETIELAIVAAGARRDLGELDAAVVGLQIPELEPTRREPWSPRLFYAYADNLLAAGRESDALQWFVHALDADTAGETDADSRIAELTGEPLPTDEETFELEDLGDVEDLGDLEDPEGAEPVEDRTVPDDAESTSEAMPSDAVDTVEETAAGVPAIDAGTESGTPGEDGPEPGDAVASGIDDGPAEAGNADAAGTADAPSVPSGGADADVPAEGTTEALPQTVPGTPDADASPEPGDAPVPGAADTAADSAETGAEGTTTPPDPSGATEEEPGR